MTSDQLQRYQIEGLIDRHPDALLQGMRLGAVSLSDNDIVEIILRREFKARQMASHELRLLSKSSSYEESWRDLARLALKVIARTRH